MFDNYIVAKRVPGLRSWGTALLGMSIAVHLVAASLFVVRGYWRIGKLPTPVTETVMAVSPPPPPLPGQARPRTPRVEPRPKPVPAREAAPAPSQQIVAAPSPSAPVASPGASPGPGAPSTSGEVVEPGEPGPGIAPDFVRPAELAQYRISGDTQIQPSDEVKSQMQRDRKDKLSPTFKLCIEPAGTVGSVALLRSSGYSAYDRKLETAMRAWRYSGIRRPTCTAITFNYSQGTDR